MTEKTESPCIGCEYLSDDKGACMFFPMMDVPFTEPREFADEGEEPEYPEYCWAKEEAEGVLRMQIAIIDELLDEADKDVPMRILRGEWSLLKQTLEWVSMLEKRH